MRCSQCSTEQPDDMTFCQKCGANLMQNDPARTFSYLPPGTPPWPKTVPSELPKQVEPASANVSTDPVKAQKVPIPAIKTPSKNIISIIAVLILAPLIGMLATLAFIHSNQTATSPTQNAASNTASSTPTSAPTSAASQSSALPNPKGFKTAQDTTVNISFRYPSDWTVKAPQKSSNASMISIVNEQYGINFFVMHLSNTASTSVTNADQLNQSNVQSLSQLQSISNIKNATPDDQIPTIGGAKWSARAATFNDSANHKFDFTTISVHHGQSYYVIYYFIPDAIYQQAMTKYIKPMLQSVKFLS